MKAIFLVLSLLIVPFSFAKTLRIGTSPENPPFSNTSANGQLFGFDVDIITAICQYIQADCKLVPLEFDYEFLDLKTGKIDLAIAAIVITDKRKESFLFSLPYFESNAAFLALQTSTINTPENIELKTVGTRLGTPFKELALSLYDNNVKVIEYPYTPQLLGALQEKKVDVILMDSQPIKYWYANNSTVYKIIGNGIPVGNGYGIMANKGQEDLMTQINQALLKMEADGTYLKIYTRYF